MLPINLLPNYIFDKNKKFKLMAFYGAVLAAIFVVLFLKYQGVQKDLKDASDDLADATTKQTKYTTVDGNIKKVQSDIAELKTKQTFIANAQAYNTAWPATFELARNLTAQNILLKSMAIDKDHRTLRLSAFAPGDRNSAEFAIANWVKALERHSDIIDQVNYQTPPHPFNGTAPTAAGTGGAPAGFGGLAGGGGPIGPPAMGGRRGPSASGGGGPIGMGMAMSGSPGGAAGGATGSDGVGYAEIEGKPGINFNVSVRLKKELAEGQPSAPSWPSSGAPAAPAGGIGLNAAPGGAPARD